MTTKPGTVVVGFLHRSADTTPQFHRCLRQLIVRDCYQNPGRIIGELDRESSANIAAARCSMVADFLQRDAEWLLMLDDDMTFPDDLLDRLLAAADPVERPIVGGLCFGVRPKVVDGVEQFNETMGVELGAFPTLYGLDADGHMVMFGGYPRNTVVQVASTGAACLLIHRDVLADDRWKHDGHPQPWFRESVLKGRTMSEDHFFCLKAGSFGYPVHVHTGARTGHVKVFVADEDWYDRWRRALPPPPAVERTAVVVPVLRRPERALPFMQSLRASTGMADVFAVCSLSADAAAWRAAGATVVTTDRKSFPCKANDALAAVDADTYPWLLLTGDDVKFWPGWLDHAQYHAAESGAFVVGTNDLGNPRVRNGVHAVHPLVRRSYIDEEGASWDGPGTIAHEGYSHWCVDDEWTAVARQRGVFTVAHTSIVEHLHPYWGKGASDDTYRQGERHAQRDLDLFAQRLARFSQPAELVA